MAILAALGAAAAAAAPIASGLINSGIAYKNYQLQGEANRDNLMMQQYAWGREDNAVQRRVADLKAAGMNPILAAGDSAASSGPIRLNAPQLSPTVDLVKPIEQKLGLQRAALALMQQKQDISKTSAEQAYVEQQTKNSSASTAWQLMQNGARASDLFKLSQWNLLSDTKGKFHDFVNAANSGQQFGSSLGGAIQDVATKLTDAASPVVTKAAQAVKDWQNGNVMKVNEKAQYEKDNAYKAAGQNSTLKRALDWYYSH